MTTTTMNHIKVRKHRDWLFPVCNTLILILLMFITLYPVLNTIAYSFNDGMDAVKGGIGIWPRVFSTDSYVSLVKDPAVYKAFGISVSKTLVTTILNLFVTSMVSYALSRKEYVLRKFITTVLVLTMYVNAGLIPGYLLVSKVLGLKNTFWAYIIPALFQCFNMIVIRTYISNSIPDALVESGKIDGAGDIRCYFQIILPLCLPVLATIALFIAVGAWNDWFSTWLYNSSKADLHTLQYLLKMKLATTQNQANAAMTSADALAAQSSKVAPITVRASITVVSALPIMVVYPFLQKYFVTGMALGSVKG